MLNYFTICAYNAFDFIFQKWPWKFNFLIANRSSLGVHYSLLHSNFCLFFAKKKKRIKKSWMEKKSKSIISLFISKLYINVLIKFFFLALKLVSLSSARAHIRKRNFSCERYLNIQKKMLVENFLAFNLFPLFLLIKSRQIFFSY